MSSASTWSPCTEGKRAHKNPTPINKTLPFTGFGPMTRSFKSEKLQPQKVTDVRNQKWHFETKMPVWSELHISLTTETWWLIESSLLWKNQNYPSLPGGVRHGEMSTPLQPCLLSLPSTITQWQQGSQKAQAGTTGIPGRSQQETRVTNSSLAVAQPRNLMVKCEATEAKHRVDFLSMMPCSLASH